MKLYLGKLFENGQIDPCCDTPIPNLFVTADTSCISLSGSGTTGSPLIATAIISPEGDNILECTDEGLYVPATAPGGFTAEEGIVFDSGILQLGQTFGSGTPQQSPLTVEREIGFDPGINLIFASTNPLLVDANTIFSPGVIRIQGDSDEGQNAIFQMVDNSTFNQLSFETGPNFTLIQTDEPVNMLFVDGLAISEASTTVDPSAILELNATTKGFLPPRVAEVDRDLITLPAIGLIIYNLDTNKLNLFTGSVWEEITSA